MEAEKAAEKLLKLSPSVRMVTFCDMKGKLVFSAHSKKVKNLLSKKESKESLRDAAKRWKSRRDHFQESLALVSTSLQNIPR